MVHGLLVMVHGLWTNHRASPTNHQAISDDEGRLRDGRSVVGSWSRPEMIRTDCFPFCSMICQSIDDGLID